MLQNVSPQDCQQVGNGDIDSSYSKRTTTFIILAIPTMLLSLAPHHQPLIGNLLETPVFESVPTTN
jgi:hypothetical protein